MANQTFSIFQKQTPASGVRPAKRNVPWVEKYRPSKVEEISYQHEVVSALKNCLDGHNLPHMMFYGPPGTGKTTAAMAVCKELFKDRETFEDRVLELNASDERGIGVVRSKIKEFAKKNCRSTASKKSLATVKIIVLDEADAMTSAAQMALRRVMESECRTTRFFIICNYVSRIIDPLTSRCVKFRFKPLPADAQIGRLEHIIKAENLKISEAALHQLVTLSDGDLRKSITRLQSLSLGFDSITSEHVVEICGRVPSAFLSKFWDTVRGQNSNAVSKFARELVRSAVSPNQFLEEIAPTILQEDMLTGIQKARLLERVGDANAKIMEGANAICVMTSFAQAVHLALASN